MKENYNHYRNFIHITVVKKLLKKTVNICIYI
uniref:Uncharacterized protein n=1 Tax=Anguilla anguilla TaxID=7936 RepID=A0A0E9PXS3_ANGAN